MRKTVIGVVVLVIILAGGIVLSHRRSVSTQPASAPSPQGTVPGPAMQKAGMFKMDSFAVDNVTLDQVMDMLNQQTALRHAGVELCLAAAAKDKEQTPITVNLKDTSLAEILDHVATATGLSLTEEGNVIILVPKKSP